MSPVPNEICYPSKGHPAAGPEQFQSSTSKCSVFGWKQFTSHDYSRQPGSLIKRNYTLGQYGSLDSGIGEHLQKFTTNIQHIESLLTVWNQFSMGQNDRYLPNCSKHESHYDECCVVWRKGDDKSNGDHCKLAAKMNRFSADVVG